MREHEAVHFFAMVSGVAFEDGGVQFVTRLLAVDLAPELANWKSEFATVVDTHDAEQEMEAFRWRAS